MELQNKNREELLEEVIRLREELAKKNTLDFENDTDSTISEYYVPDHFICKHYLDGTLFSVNEKVSKLFGIPQKEENNFNIKDLMPASNHKAYEAYIKKLLNKL